MVGAYLPEGDVWIGLEENRLLLHAIEVIWEFQNIPGVSGLSGNVRSVVDLLVNMWACTVLFETESFSVALANLKLSMFWGQAGPKYM